MASNSRRRPIGERFWSKVSGGDVETCWMWTGASHASTGYATFRADANRQVMVHRYAYETLRSEIPAGLQIDHLCRVTLCVNPWHMEPVTPRVNVMRSSNPAALNMSRTACSQGHPFSEANTYRSAGQRRCKACHRLREQRYAAARREAKAGEQS